MFFESILKSWGSVDATASWIRKLIQREPTLDVHTAVALEEWVFDVKKVKHGSENQSEFLPEKYREFQVYTLARKLDDIISNYNE